MKFPLPRWSKSTPRADDALSPTDPGLTPDRVPTPPPPVRQQLPQVLGDMAQMIVEHEVQGLLDTVDCRYELLVLTFWVSAANQPALRNLVDVNQRSPQVARDIVVRGLTKTSPEAARLLNTVRLKLEFKPGDNLPRGVSEVLLVCGRETVVLPFSYTGQIQLESDPADSQPLAGLSPVPGGRAATQLVSAAQPVAGGMPSTAGALVLWAQWPGQAGLLRWRFAADEVAATTPNGVLVGVNPDSGVPVADLPYISGLHLKLLPPAQAGAPWQVVDVSRNGAALFNPHDPAGEGEAALFNGQPHPLPPSGALRLGPLPDSPLLHFYQQAALPVTTAVAPATVAARAQRRVTHLAALPVAAAAGV